jgi:hypothetical protein
MSVLKTLVAVTLAAGPALAMDPPPGPPKAKVRALPMAPNSVISRLLAEARATTGTTVLPGRKALPKIPERTTVTFPSLPTRSGTSRLLAPVEAWGASSSSSSQSSGTPAPTTPVLLPFTFTNGSSEGTALGLSSDAAPRRFRVRRGGTDGEEVVLGGEGHLRVGAGETLQLQPVGAPDTAEFHICSSQGLLLEIRRHAFAPEASREKDVVTEYDLEECVPHP